MPAYLIVANQTLGGAELLDHVRSLVKSENEEPCTFHLVVPATPSKDHLTWTEGEAHTIADHRLAEGLDRLRSMGAEATGEVGDASPLLAVDDALRHRTVDAVIVTTLPVGLSKWLKMDLPARIGRKFQVPVTHIVVQPEASVPGR